MIELRSGVPGSGKTLSMVQALSNLLESWNKNPEEGRPIFVHGISDLALSHSPLPLITPSGASIHRMVAVPDWDSMPDGSLVIVDECQSLFPPRSSQTSAPAHVAWLNTHRHRGFDIWLTTQHPKLIDFSVRALVGKHLHFRRLFGSSRAACYEWDGCSDNLAGMKDSVMTFFKFPKDAFKFYKSAEIHTKQSFRLPRWLLIPLAGVVLGAFMIPQAYKVLSGAFTGKGVSQSQKTFSVSGMAPSPAATQTSKSISSVPVGAAVADVSLSVGVPVSVAASVVFSGCIMSKDSCGCFDSVGKVVEKSSDFCDGSVGRSRAAPLSFELLPLNPLASSFNLALSFNDVEALSFIRARRQLLGGLLVPL